MSLMVLWRTCDVPIWGGVPAMSSCPPCPVCGADDALHPRAEHAHHPPRWLRWITILMHEYITRSYTCDRCGATSEMGHVRARAGTRRALSHPCQPLQT
jgi:hypothetical protein